VRGLTFCDGYLPFCPPTLAEAEEPYFVEVSAEWICLFYWRAKYLKFSALSGTISSSLDSPGEARTLSISADIELQSFSGSEPDILSVSAGFTESKLGCFPSTRTPLFRESQAGTTSEPGGTFADVNSGEIAITGSGSEAGTFGSMGVDVWSYLNRQMVSSLVLRYKEGKFYAYPVHSAFSSVGASINAPYDNLIGGVALLKFPWEWTEQAWTVVGYEASARYAAQSAGTLTFKLGSEPDVVFQLYSGRSVGFSLFEDPPASPPEPTSSGSISIAATVEPNKYWTYGGIYDEDTGERV